MAHLYAVGSEPNDEFYLALGKCIRAAREARGWTQTRLAQLMRCRQPTISDYETAEIRPPLEAFWRLSEILGVDMYHLLGQPCPRVSPHKRPTADPIAHLR